MLTLQQIETALDNGQLWVLMGSGRYWRCRRNGATKTWKRKPNRFSIPVKAGMYAYTHITETSTIGSWHRNSDFVICHCDPNPMVATLSKAWGKVA